MKKSRRVIAGLLTALILTQSTTAYAGKLDDLFGQAKASVEGAIKDVAGDAANSILSKISPTDLLEIVKDTSKDWDSLSLFNFGDQVTTKVIDRICSDALTWLGVTDAKSSETLRNIFFTLTDKFGIDLENTQRLWNAATEFAEKNGITTLTAAKLSTASVVQAAKKDGFAYDTALDYINDNISSWIDSSEITNEEQALRYLDEIIEDLKS